MSDPYPRRYWWVVLVAVPITVGLIAIIPKFSGGSSSTGNNIKIEGANVSGTVQIVGTQVIINQLKDSSSDGANIQDVEVSINRAVNLVQVSRSRVLVFAHG